MARSRRPLITASRRPFSIHTVKRCREALVVCRDGAAFATGDALGRVERVAGRVGELARTHTVTASLDAVSGVFHDAQAMSIGDRAKCAHIDHLAVEMDRKDRAS